jgi:hypothetical protein
MESNNIINVVNMLKEKKKMESQRVLNYDPNGKKMLENLIKGDLNGNLRGCWV